MRCEAPCPSAVKTLCVLRVSVVNKGIIMRGDQLSRQWRILRKIEARVRMNNKILCCYLLWMAGYFNGYLEANMIELLNINPKQIQKALRLEIINLFLRNICSIVLFQIIVALWM